MVDSKLVLTSYKSYEAAFLLSGAKLMDLRLFDDDTLHIGDIFIGKVNNIVPSIDAAFVSITSSIRGFLPLQNVKENAILHHTSNASLKGNDEIVVQVLKEPSKSKDAVLTCDLSFQNDCFVILPFSSGIHFSKKISSSKRDILKQNLEIIREECETITYGMIVRTQASLESFDELKKQYMELLKKVNHVLTIMQYRTVYSKLSETRSFWSECYEFIKRNPSLPIVTDQKQVFENIIQEGYTSNLVTFYEDNHVSLLQLYGMEAQIKDALSEKVWLKSGGFLIIQATEAMTVIDVNIGKGVSQKDMEEAYLKLNLEAACEISRQLRIRNISGIIIIDFINMKNASSVDYLISSMQELVKKDPIETNVIDLTKLGLMELTRKKTTPPLSEKLFIDNFR